MSAGAQLGGSSVSLSQGLSCTYSKMADAVRWLDIWYLRAPLGGFFFYGMFHFLGLLYLVFLSTRTFCNLSIVGRITFLLPYSEVPEGHFFHILSVKAVTDTV